MANDINYTYTISEYTHLPFFKDFPESLIRSIDNAAFFRSYIPGKMVISKDLPGQSTYMILKGNVNVFCTSYQGRKFVLSKLEPGDWFNVITCIKHRECNPASVCALTPVKLLVLSCKSFNKLYEEEPLFALRIMQNISERTTNLTLKLEQMVLLSVSGRIADFLIDHADNDGVIYWKCTQNDIANRIGTVAEVVGRTLRQFADEDLIIMPEKNCIVIKDLEGLKKKALGP